MTPISSFSTPLIVVDRPHRWPFRIPDVEVVAARTYLTHPDYGTERRATVFNLCRSYRYQSTGYYVSLLAAARGHRPRPGVGTIQDMKSQAILRVVSDELDTLIRRSLGPLRSKEFALSIYFGRNLAKRYDALALRLSSFFEAPLLRARFVKNARWQLLQLQPIAASDVPQSHRPEVARFAREYFVTRPTATRRRKNWRYDLAILHDPDADEPPSDAAALRRFAKAARDVGLRTTEITKNDYGRLGEFDALFIRETTSVNHYTYRFAQRAAAEGLVVVDDPESIVRCTNKVYLAETAARRGIPVPETHILHRDNVAAMAEELDYPRVLKQPDSSFSAGVEKVEDAVAFREAATRLLGQTELILAQEFLPTPFDWRVGVLGNEALYACRYHMASDHWQIINPTASLRRRYGKVETLPVEEVPRPVVRSALRAARLMGSGFYGVDLKTVGRKCYVIEVNDNPSVESGYEDKVLGAELYRRIAEWFLRHLEERGR